MTFGVCLLISSTRFSAYIYGRPQGDVDVLRVAYAVEHSREVRKELQPYKVPKRDLVDFVKKK